jgi:hypothetical protein
VRPLVEAHEAELPRAMLEAWEQMFGVVSLSANPDAAPGRLDRENLGRNHRRPTGGPE